MKSLMSTGFRMPKTKSVLLSLGPLNAKVRFLESVTRLQELGYSLYATSGTSMFLVTTKNNFWNLFTPILRSNMEFTQPCFKNLAEQESQEFWISSPWRRLVLQLSFQIPCKTQNLMDTKSGNFFFLIKTEGYIFWVDTQLILVSHWLW